ncbi:ubiquinone biosynthesis O-methyltransferase [Panus rudis PR-1116 ss-1]|nr:ubiquinone biosynthesis O-methyltransferase [Panus rudis PR-1116 ss-1]
MLPRAVSRTAATALRTSRRRGPLRSLHVNVPRSIAAEASSSSSASTVNDAEIAHFSRLSSLWWDEQGEFGMLHRMNPIRTQFVREKLAEIKYDDGHEGFDELKVLEGLDVLDVGCGGGLLSESLARLGANTLGIDASASNIGIASLHASSDPALTSSGKGKGRLTYEHTSAEDLLAQRGPASFDVVCSIEVLEHVDNPRSFLDSCAQLVKPGGNLFLSTIARTPLAYLLTIFAAEKLLRFVEPGTHTYDKYVNPDELLRYFNNYRSPASTAEASVPTNLRSGQPWISRLYSGRPSRVEAEIRGMLYVPWNGQWVLAPRNEPWAEGCNYLFWVRRPKE